MHRRTTIAPTTLLALTLGLGAVGCGGGAGRQDAAAGGPIDQRALAPDTARDAGTPPDVGADVGADATPGGAAERFAGIWAKDKTGEALVVRNDCGDFWRIDFDYGYSKLEPTSATTLRLHHCADPDCAETDSITGTLTVQGDAATAAETADLEAAADCTIQTASSTRLTLESAGRGLLRWRAALTYVGGGCGPFKPPQTEGDRCEAIAETGVTRLD